MGGSGEQQVDPKTLFLSTSNRSWGTPCNAYFETPNLLTREYQNVKERQQLRFTLHHVIFKVNPSAFVSTKGVEDPDFFDITTIRIHSTLGLDVTDATSQTDVLAEFCPWAWLQDDSAGRGIGTGKEYFINFVPNRWPPQTSYDGMVPNMRIWMTDQNNNYLLDYDPFVRTDEQQTDPTPLPLPTKFSVRQVLSDISYKFFVELIRDRSEDEVELLRSIKQQLELSFELQKFVAHLHPAQYLQNLHNQNPSDDPVVTEAEKSQVQGINSVSLPDYKEQYTAS